MPTAKWWTWLLPNQKYCSRFRITSWSSFSSLRGKPRPYPTDSTQTKLQCYLVSVLVLRCYHLWGNQVQTWPSLSFLFFSFFAFSVFLSRFLLSFASFSAASSSLDLGGFHFLSMPDEQEYAWAFHTNNPLSTWLEEQTWVCGLLHHTNKQLSIWLRTGQVEVHLHIMLRALNEKRPATVTICPSRITMLEKKT